MKASPIVLLLIGLWFAWSVWGQSLTPVPTPPPSVDDLGTSIALQSVFTGAGARADAEYLALYFDALAGRIEVDGQQPAPRLTDRAQVERLVADAGAAVMADREHLAVPQFTGLSGVVGSLFQARFPREAGTLSAEDRRTAVTLLHALAAGCRKAVAA